MSPRSLGVGTVAALLAWLVASPTALASVESELAFHRGVVAYGEGRYEEARRQFEAILAEDPDDAAALQYLGLIAQATGDVETSLARLNRALALDPDDVDVRTDLAGALLAAERDAEAAAELDTVLAADAEHARAHLYRGIAAYRLGEASQAISHLERAVELDPALATEARYYSGLSQAIAGNWAASAGAFSELEEDSPNHPLAQSARNLQGRLAVAQEATKPWRVAATAGAEFDSNPTVVGTGRNEDEDLVGIFRLEGSGRWDRGGFSAQAGYDGFLSLHSLQRNEDVDQQTHLTWLNLGYTTDNWYLSLRYDWAITLLDLDDEFRQLHGVTSSVTRRVGNWGATQFFYQFQSFDFDEDLSDLETFDDSPDFGELDRDGPQHSVGLTQFVFPGEPFSYLRGGFVFTTFDPDGTEFRFDAYEANLGASGELPLGISATAFYRYIHRDYRVTSIFDSEERTDDAQRITVQLRRALAGPVELTVASTLTLNESDVGVYDYNRVIVGSYLTARF
ncbi:MAG: tetratricopeptide repeat protein [Proteobacteria bacterium]|nr:tetratricopeptide repeat protein [Pseudomonadota bacterium]